MLTQSLVMTATLLIAAVAGFTATHVERPDCPGKIICPLNGELVCKDRCPLGEKAEQAASACDVPACCKARADR